jgi:hypothetical protein
MTTNLYSLYSRRSTFLSENVQYLFIAVILLISANSLKILTDEFILGVFAFTFFLFLLKRRNFDNIVIIMLCAWCIINFVSYIFNRTSFDIWTFTGFVVKMVYPYFILKLVGETFFEKFEKIIFFLACLSLPLFVIQIVYPGFIDAFTSVFKPITTTDMPYERGWYGIVFRVEGSAAFRNSGFMWEPGAYAFMLIIALLYRIVKFGMQLDIRNIVYIIALLTTFSTMAYLGVAILFISYAVSSKKIGIILFMVPLAILYMGFVSDLDFMLPKINNYFNTADKSYTPMGQTYLKVNRVAYILFVFQQSILWPFGFGIIPSKYMYAEYHDTILEGVGTIANLLLFWGWIGLAFFITAIYKFLKSFQIYTDRTLLIFALIIVIIAFFSNPLEKSPILYSIVFYPFIFNNIDREYV